MLQFKCLNQQFSREIELDFYDRPYYERVAGESVHSSHMTYLFEEV